MNTASAAESPALLEVYMRLSELQEQETAFDETERQVLFLAVSSANNCEYCAAGHSTIASMKKVSPGAVAAVRDGLAHVAGCAAGLLEVL